MFGKGGSPDAKGAGSWPASGFGMRTDVSSQLRGAASHLGTDRQLEGGPRWSTASVAVPKGGGALKSIAEAFRANPATGSGTTQIPLAVTPARGLEPQLALSYDSGSGNGPYGHGWSVGLGQISRRTDRGLPRYFDTPGRETDTFVLSDAEDLVPLLIEGPPGTWIPDSRTEGDYRVDRYRPRVEGGFARIERWTHTGTQEAHWRVRDRTNVLRTYGQAAASRVADPADPTHVFTWLLDEILDDKGNRVVVSYDRDDPSRGVSTAFYDSARYRGLAPFVQAYPRRISYGNATPHALGDSATDFVFRVVFDWGDLADRAGNTGETAAYAVPTADVIPNTNPPERADAFSTRRPGFEVRTRWRCERIVLLHAIDLDGDALSSAGTWLPVRSWHLAYDAGTHLAKLTSVTQVGWRTRKEGADLVTDALAMPAVTFGYSAATLGTTSETVGTDRDRVPDVVDGQLWRFVDLDGEGLPGLFTEQGGAWYYKRNEGDPALRATPNRTWFGSMSALRSAPTAKMVHGAALADVDGDGRVEVLVRSGPTAGTWSRTADQDWDSFRPFRRLPNLDWNDPDLRLTDLTGDGRADLVHLRNDRLQWWPSEGRDGFGDTEYGVETGRDEVRHPTFVKHTRTDATFLADMTGDGLADLVRVNAHGVCYWPNLGYGRFGAQVFLANAPQWPHDEFRPERVRLVDADGSGTTDLIYFDHRGVWLALNLSGNAFAELQPIRGMPPATDADHVEAVDLLGDGTACLVWSRPYAQTKPRFVRLMAEGKPHLLTRVLYGTGAEVHLSYTPSTRFTVDDRAAGTPWATRLPFPVQCLSRVETVDHAREHTLVTTYTYHHGFYDPHEREFRGFGRVDQWDAETVGSDAIAPAIPMRTSTWFHTGAWIEQSSLEAVYATEWFTGDAAAPTLEPNRITTAGTLTPPERREAARALKGRVLRQELWRADGAPEAPYLVTTQTYETVPLQPRRTSPNESSGVRIRTPHLPGAYHVVERGKLTVAYDEHSDDPRISQQLVLEVDGYGTPVCTAAVAFPRRGTGHPSEQATPLVVTTQQDVVHDDATPDRLRLGVPWQVRRWEIGGLDFPADGAAWTVAGLDAALAAISQNVDPHEAPPVSGAWRRLIGLQVQRYADPTNGATLDLGAVGAVLLPVDVRTLMMTTDLLGASGLDSRAGWTTTARDAALVECGYVLGSSWAGATPPAAWAPPADAVWATSGATAYLGASGFRQVSDQTDPFGTTTTIGWDAHHLQPVTVTTPVGAVTHVMSAAIDPHTLQPARVTDINGSDTVVAFDPLGRVTKVANLGRPGETVDDLDHPTVTFDYTFASYDAGSDTWTPARAHTTTRRTHWAGATSDAPEVDETWIWFDGLGRPLLTKAPAAPARYVGSGRVILDAKGNPVKQYEPYFSDTSEWESDASAAMQGVTPILTYDPIGRLVCTDFPDGTHTRIERTPWDERHFDRNDTLPDVADPGFEASVAAGTWSGSTGHPWLDARATAAFSGGADPLDTTVRAAALRVSALQSYAVRDTPTVLHVDVLGRPFLEQRTKSTAGDTTDVRVTLDVLGRATQVAAEYEGTSGRVSQLATADVFDLLGRSIRHVRRDAQTKNGTTGLAEGGTTWVLPTADGQPGYRWDSREQAFRSTFDALRRPVATFVAAEAAAEVCATFVRYGEEATDAQARRLYGQAWRTYDAAGLVETVAIDVDGRVAESTRQFVAQYFPPPDWTALVTNPAATEPAWVTQADGSGDEVFTQTATFDVAGRPIDDAIHRDPAAKCERRYTYDVGGRLVGVEARIRGGAWQPVVHAIAYNARGQRVQVTAGDDAGAAALETGFTYDPATFRLVRLRTTRLTDDEVLQDFRWVHDAAGNVTFQESAADDTVWYANGTVTPHRGYAYDALDRLVQATGREHTSTFDSGAGWPGSQGQRSASYDTGPVAHKADGSALRTYTQTYTYDDVGNFTELRHVAGAVTSVRTYAYEPEADGSLFNNQLHRTTVGSTNFDHTYDAHGNTTSLSHLFDMGWDAFDRLQSVQTAARSQPSRPSPDHAPVHDWFYVYDGSGQRVRKVKATLVEYDPSGDPGVLVADGVARQEERFYVGPFEVWRKVNADGSTDTERETLHVMDDQRRVAMVETLTWDADAAVTSPTNRWRYQLDDHLGTSVGEVTEEGLEIGWEEYHPYGTTALWSFDSSREVSGKRYRYTGMERDDETGLALHGARFYSPWSGTWISSDPIGIAGGHNTYAYAASRPTVLQDENGTRPGEKKGPQPAAPAPPVAPPLAQAPAAPPAPPQEFQHQPHPGPAQARLSVVFTGMPGPAYELTGSAVDRFVASEKIAAPVDYDAFTVPPRITVSTQIAYQGGDTWSIDHVTLSFDPRPTMLFPGGDPLHEATGNLNDHLGGRSLAAREAMHARFMQVYYTEGLIVELVEGNLGLTSRSWADRDLERDQPGQPARPSPIPSQFTGQRIMLRGIQIPGAIEVRGAGANAAAAQAAIDRHLQTTLVPHIQDQLTYGDVLMAHFFNYAVEGALANPYVAVQDAAGADVGVRVLDPPAARVIQQRIQP